MSANSNEKEAAVAPSSFPVNDKEASDAHHDTPALSASSLSSPSSPSSALAAAVAAKDPSSLSSATTTTTTTTTTTKTTTTKTTTTETNENKTNSHAEDENRQSEGDTHAATAPVSSSSSSSSLLARRPSLESVPVDILMERQDESAKSHPSVSSSTASSPSSSGPPSPNLSSSPSSGFFSGGFMSSLKRSFKRPFKRYSIEMSIPIVSTPPTDMSADDRPSIGEEDEEKSGGAPLSPAILAEEPPGSPIMLSNSMSASSLQDTNSSSNPSSPVMSPAMMLAMANTSGSPLASPIDGERPTKERTNSLRRSLVRRFSFGRKDSGSDSGDEKKDKASDKRRERRLSSSSSFTFLGTVGSSALSSLSNYESPDIKFFDLKLRSLFKKNAKQTERLQSIQDLIPAIRSRSFDYGTFHHSKLVVAGALLEAWRFLMKNMSGTTYESRAFYFRAIVLIMKRHELRLHEYTDDPDGYLPDLYSEYSKLLTETHNYVVERLSRKGLYVSLLGFGIEVLAINYFLMPTLASQIISMAEQSYMDIDADLDPEINEMILDIRKADAQGNKTRIKRASSTSSVQSLQLQVDALSLASSGSGHTSVAPIREEEEEQGERNRTGLRGSFSSSGLGLSTHKGLQIDPKTMFKGPWVEKFHAKKEPEFFLMFFKTLCRRIIEINIPTTNAHVSIETPGTPTATSTPPMSSAAMPFSPLMTVSEPISPLHSVVSSMASQTSPVKPSNECENGVGQSSPNMSVSTNSSLSTATTANGDSEGATAADAAKRQQSTTEASEEDPGTPMTLDEKAAALLDNFAIPNIDWFAVRGYSTLFKSFISLALSTYFPPDVRETMIPPPPLNGAAPMDAQLVQQILAKIKEAARVAAQKAQAAAPPALFTPELMVVFDNPHAVSIITKVFLRRTSVLNIRAVTSMLSFVHDLISHYCHLQSRPLPAEFDYAYFLRALSILFESQHYVVLMATLSFLYRHMHVFSTSCRHAIVDLLLTRFFFKFFLHWQGSVRWFFFHILLYRLMPFSNLKSIEEFIPLLSMMPEQFVQSFLQWAQRNPVHPHDMIAGRKLHENVMCIRARYTMLVTIQRSANQSQAAAFAQVHGLASSNLPSALSSSPLSTSPSQGAGVFGSSPTGLSYLRGGSLPIVKQSLPHLPAVFALDFDVDTFSYEDQGTPMKNLESHCAASGCKLGDIARALKEYIDCQAENLKWIRERIQQNMAPAAEDLHLAFPKLLLKLPNLKSEV